MDTDKSSNQSKGPELSNVMAPEDTALTDKGDRQREEEKEADPVTVDGSVAVPSVSQRRAQEKHRYNTIGYQKKKQRTVVDFSTVSKGTSAGGKTRGALKQVLFNQGASDKNGTSEERSVAQGQVDALKLVLNSFNIPADLRWTWGEGGTERTLEDSWTDIVDSHVHERMTKTERHQQEALWELLNTELTYINKLTIAKDFVLAALSHCHGYGFLLEVSPTMLFSNLPSILDAHRLFWHEVMYPMLQEARLTEQPFDPMKLEAGCLQFPDRFPAYFEYCWEGDRNVEFARRQLDTNPQFHTYLTWVENHPQCGRMRLGDMQAKPHQRITKYPLLLKAVLKNTQNLPTQNALERMLNSVNNFLESINDYLHLKEALSVAAQRIEEHKIEGLSEEIDKHVRELCCFDLMSPMRGVGPNDIRKLLLEETLKVRGRKDNKELVVLLFTDVLLMTKTQKKSDKLKVVRPPLPLERLHCIELKDGCSFVLVEVGDLGCAVSVNLLSTPSPDSCSTWVSALRETQATLETLRRKETNKTLKITSELVGSEKPPIQNELVDKDIEVFGGQSDSERSDDEFDTAEYVNKLRNERRRSETQILTDVEEGKVQQPAEDKNSRLIGLQNNQSKSTHEEAENGYWVEEAPLKKFNERRATWKHKEQASPNSNEITQLVRNGHSLLPAGHVEKNGTSSQFIPSTSLSNKPPTSTYGARVETGKPLLDPYDDSQGIRRQSLYSQPEDHTGFLTDSGRFVRNVKSPRLQRRQTNNLQPSIASDSSKKAVNVLEITQYNANSNGNQRRASSPCITPHDSHRVLKLGSLKNKHETLWNVPEKRSSPDPETLSEPEQRPHENRQTKHKLKTQRSLSQSSHRRNLSPSPGMDNQLHLSTLQDALQRAKEREKERAVGKRVGNTEERTLSVDNSSISASPSPKEEKAAKHQEPAGLRMISAYGWIEGNVDGSDDEKESSVLEGVSVDWPGWCFDDEEVFNFEDFDDEDRFEQILTKNDLRSSEKKRSERHDETEWSEV